MTKFLKMKVINGNERYIDIDKIALVQRINNIIDFVTSGYSFNEMYDNEEEAIKAFENYLSILNKC